MTTFLLLALAALYTGIAIPLVRRRVPPNKTYGICTAATRADESVWYDANAAGGRDLILLSVVFVICGLALPNDDFGIAMAMLLLISGTLLMAVTGSVRAKRMLRERRAEEPALADGDAMTEAPTRGRRQRTR